MQIPQPSVVLAAHIEAGWKIQGERLKRRDGNRRVTDAVAARSVGVLHSIPAQELAQVIQITMNEYR